MRRSWIKLYVGQVLRGTCFTELDEPERFIWFGFLLLAGDSPYAGIITATEEFGYSDEQLADLLKTNVELVRKSKKKMIEFGKISVDDKNKIHILKWEKYQSEYNRQKGYREATPSNKINYRMSLQIYDSLRYNKGGRHWEELVGYTLDDLKINLENKFLEGMNWGNMGKWHIDHIIPKSSFKFQTNDDKEFKDCWSLENLQPLWAYDNLVKGKKMGLQRGVTTQGATPIEIEKEIEIKKEIKKKKDIYSPTSNEVRLSTLLLNLILDRKDNFKKPDIQKWCVHIDRLLHIDNRTPQEIEKVIRWCQQDDFWCVNILSTEKLRKQIDKLEIKMNNKPSNSQQTKQGANYGKIKRHTDPYPEGTPFE